jgi:hypothetical protein
MLKIMNFHNTIPLFSAVDDKYLKAVSKPHIEFKATCPSKPSGEVGRQGEVFNRRNIWNILRIECFAPTPDLSPSGGFEMAFKC